MTMNTQVNGLIGNWILSVTDKLEPIAAEKVAKEAYDKYQKTFEHYLSLGLSESEAKIVAVQFMGDSSKMKQKYFFTYFNSFGLHYPVLLFFLCVIVLFFDFLIGFRPFDITYDMNMDIILGVPNTSIEDYKNALNWINSLNPIIGKMVKYLSIVFMVISASFIGLSFVYNQKSSASFKIRAELYAILAMLLSRSNIMLDPNIPAYWLFGDLAIGLGVIFFYRSGLQRRARALAS